MSRARARNSYWQNHCGGRADVLNETVFVNGHAMTVVGVDASSNIFAPQDRLASRQELGPQVIAFPALAIGLREHRGLAFCSRHALQACCR
jgi:hypothetical protein